MKNKYIVVSFLTCIFFYGCNKSENSLDEKTVFENFPEFKASTGMDTKTSLSGLDVIWSTDDRVAIFNGTTEMKEYKVKAGYDGKTTTTLTPVNKDFTAGAEGSDMDANVAFYPSSVINSCSKSETGFSLSVNLPNTIKYAPTSFGEGSMPMVAVTDSKNDYNLSFKNLFGIMKLQLKGDGVIVYSIAISGNSDEKISGEASVSCSYGANPTISFDNSSNTSIVLNCGDGIELSPEKSTPFYIAVPPVKFTSGITMRVTTSKGIVEKKSSKSLEIERSKITPLSEVFIVCKQQENNQILYSTIDGEPLVISNEMSFGDARILSNKYGNGQGIITFDKNVTSFCLDGAKQLKSIWLPKSVTVIGKRAFMLCQNLDIVIIPEDVTIIGDLAFYACSSLTSVELPKNLVSIGERAFVFCARLTSTIIPENVRSIGSSAFYGTHLSSINIPSNITVIERTTFGSCSWLSSIVIPSNVTSIGESSFANCKNLVSVEIHNGVKNIGKYAFEYCNLTSIVLPESIIYIGERAFGGYKPIEHFELLAKTPPVIEDKCFLSGQEIYVLPECVDIYMKNSSWNKYAIKPIEQ